MITTGVIFRLRPKYVLNVSNVNTTGKHSRMVTECALNVPGGGGGYIRFSRCVISDEEYSRCSLGKRNTYTKEKHFNDTLDIFLCRKDLKEDVAEFARSLPNNITKAEIRQEIKRQRKTGFSRFLRNIRCIASGIESKPVRWEDVAVVRRDFEEREDELKKSLGERKNSINVWYKLYKLFQHNEVDVDMEDFPLPKPKKLKEYEEIMEKVSETLGWEWIKV